MGRALSPGDEERATGNGSKDDAHTATWQALGWTRGPGRHGTRGAARGPDRVRRGRGTPPGDRDPPGPRSGDGAPLLRGGAGDRTGQLRGHLACLRDAARYRETDARLGEEPYPGFPLRPGGGAGAPGGGTAAGRG